jgi:hypothetical protein
MENKLVLVILALWCLGLTIGFGLALHELIQTKEQAVVAQSVSMRANDNTDKWAREYAHHVRLYHEK